MNSRIFIAGLLFAGAAFVVRKAQAAEPDSIAYDDTDWYPFDNSISPLVIPEDLSMSITLDQKISALLAVIRDFESNNDYFIKYGGGHFTDTSKFPDTWVPITMGKYKGQHSSASGAYQINKPTYNDFAPRLGITDFSPASQDRLAWEILKNTGAFNALENDNYQSALNLASKRWASLPGSDAGQNPQSMQVALNRFNSYLV